MPKEVWWDNPKTVATAILAGRQRKLHPRYLALASHYNFEPLFCMPARGNEKPYVENRVKNLAASLGHAGSAECKDLAELNDYCVRCCEADLERVATGQSETIGRRFEEDRAAAPFACRSILSTRAFASRARWTSTRRSPSTATVTACRAVCLSTATVKGYVDRIEIVVDGASRCPARAELCHGRTGARSAALPVVWDASRPIWTTRRSSRVGSCRPFSANSASKLRSSTACIRRLTSIHPRACNYWQQHPAATRCRGNREMPIG